MPVPMLLRVAARTAALPVTVPRAALRATAYGLDVASRTVGGVAGTRPVTAWRSALAAGAHPHRRVWAVEGRAHIELRPVPRVRYDAFAERLRSALEELPGVDRAIVIPAVSRVVVVGADARMDPVSVVAAVERVEELHGAAHHRGDLPEHPADLEPIWRLLGALYGDVLGLGASVVGRLGHIPVLPLEEHLATTFALLEGTPVFRHVVERAVGVRAADVGLAVVNALGQGLARRPLGPAVDVAHRSLLLGAALARREVWVAREAELIGPEQVASTAFDERPRPLPEGPIERYVRLAFPVTVTAAAAGWMATRRLERAGMILTAGLPKAARLGREAFAAELTRVFAARGVLVRDGAALQRLDRVDRLVIDADLLRMDGDGQRPDGALELLAAIASAELGLHVLGRCDAELRSVSTAVHRPGSHATVVRRLQQQGHVVAVVSRGGRPGFDGADVAFALCAPHGPVAWGAHILATDRLEDAALLVASCTVARRVSQQSVRLALTGAGVATLIGFGGVLPGANVRAGSAVNAASAVAITNGLRAGMTLARRPVPTHSPRPPWHAMSAAQVLARLGTNAEGLSTEQAHARGNEADLSTTRRVGLLQAVMDELVNPLTPVLVAGSGLSLAVGSFSDASMVMGVLGVNALVGAVQRLRADRAILALDGNHETTVATLRDGTWTTLSSRHLVPGDVIRLEAGDVVPGDCRILAADGVEADESAVTGESATVTKTSEPSPAALVAERTSMLYAGTSVAVGQALGVVVATGMDTEAGRAAALSMEELPETGVEARLRQLTDTTLPASMLGGLGLVGLGLLRGVPLPELASAGVSLAVAAVPEGLPLLATAAQTSAARRLALHGALVRNVRAVEALGRVDVVCFDKTGTLTEGHIDVTHVTDGRRTFRLDEEAEAVARTVATALRATPDATNGRLPHATDRAVVRAAAVAGVAAATGAEGWKPVAALPFDPARGYHATLGHAARDRRVAVKGAPEVVLPRCRRWLTATGKPAPLSEPVREALAVHVEQLARGGHRLLAVAERHVNASAVLVEASVDELTLVGFLVLSDSVRPAAADALEELRRAGARAVMITGDHPSTAESIAAELGLLRQGEVVTAAELDALDDEGLGNRIERVSVFARVTPEHKVRIVRALQRHGRVVAMTGDGANDAPAIRLADVGIALGARATTAARAAADVVVVDDRIETIVRAVVEGRALWRSVRDAVAVLVGGNLGEIAFTLLGSASTGRPPINARQLLLVNLLTDVAPAMAIAVREPHRVSAEQLLGEGPERSLGKALDREIVVRATVTASAATGAWTVGRMTGTPGRARTVALTALVGAQLGQTLAVGLHDPTVLATALGTATLLVVVVQTPGVSHFFGCRPLGPVGWATGVGAATLATVGGAVWRGGHSPALAQQSGTR